MRNTGSPHPTSKPHPQATYFHFYHALSADAAFPQQVFINRILGKIQFLDYRQVLYIVTPIILQNSTKSASPFDA